ncbi:shugoshin 2 [Peromyscus eremicus]|uniref:shugoshin 2 n=1 Tax=Peromyscus eremicus TaxID=42410 RepID=UPI0027DAEB02|nr:shugoshin 2 [Peromyscus eremicus]XP_059133933.1 shugoshin 2 [Peromyscus eremicus]
MEYPVMEVDSGIKRRVKDRITKTKLNVSLASKIRTKILNNSSIFKISLKHNNRALARALSREKENSRRITTEKMLLQKEVEKLNFENTFLRLKLNNLNKKLIEIESLVNNNLITAIEMSSLSEFHQGSFLLSAGKRKRISKQCKSVHLPFARVPLTSENDDDDDDDDDDGKWKTKCNNRITSKTSPDITSSVSRQSLSLQQCTLEVLLPKEDNQNICASGYSEHTSSVDVLPKESHYDSDQSPKNSLSEMKTVPSTSLRREKPSLNNVTERRKRGSSPAENLYVTDLDHQQISGPGFSWNNEINGRASETSSQIQNHPQCFPNLPSASASAPSAKHMEIVQDTDDLQLQKTVCENADMDLTASEVSKIITISKSNKNQSKKKTDCGKETFRKVKDPSSEKRRERSKKKCKGSSEMGAEEKIENKLERGSVVLDDREDSEDPNCIPDTEQPPQANVLKKITLQSSVEQENIQTKKRKQTHTTDEQEETYPFSQRSVQLLQDSKLDQCQNALYCNRSKPSRQTFVIHKSEKDNLFPSQKDEETSSGNLQVANEFHIADLSTKNNENVCDYETQTMLDLKKFVNAQQNQSKIDKPKQKINRRTKIISSMNQIYEDNDKDIHVLEKANFPLQTQVTKETTYGNIEASKEFEGPSLFTRNNGNLRDYKTQNILDLHKQITSIHPAQNESQISKIPRQKVNRKTEIISGVNRFSNDRGVHCSEKDEAFLPQKDKDIPGTFKDLSEFEMPALCDKDSTKLGDYTTQTFPNMQPACHDSKVGKKPRQKVYRKTEIISKINQIHENDGGSVHDPLNKELCQKVNKSESISQTNHIYENINEDVNAFQSYLKDQNVMNCYCGEINSNKEENCDSIPDPCELVKKQRKELPGRAENILTGDKNKRILQLTDSPQKSVTLESGLHHDTNEVDSGPGEPGNLSKSQKQNTVGSLEDAFSVGVAKGGNHPAKRDNKLTSKSKKRKTPLDLSSDTHGVLTGDMNKGILQLIDSPQKSVTLESGLHHDTNEVDSGPGEPANLSKSQKQSTVGSLEDAFSVGMAKGGNRPAKRDNKLTSKSKKRKTPLDLSSDTHGAVEITPNTDHTQSVDSQQTDKENYLENEKIAKSKPDFYTKVLKPLSQIRSPNIKNSSLDNMCESSVPLSISSSKNLMMEENSSLESVCIFPVGDGADGKIKERSQKSCRRTQKSGIGREPFQDLVGSSSSVPSNTADPESESEVPPAKLPRRKRQCTPLNLREPNLVSKMRR